MNPGDGPKQRPDAALILRRQRDQARAQRDRALAEVCELKVLLERDTNRAWDLQVQIGVYDALLAGALDIET